MEGHSVQVPVHVTVLMATVGVHVEVSCKKNCTNGPVVRMTVKIPNLLFLCSLVKIDKMEAV